MPCLVLEVGSREALSCSSAKGLLLLLLWRPNSVRVLAGGLQEANPLIRRQLREARIRAEAIEAIIEAIIGAVEVVAEPIVAWQLVAVGDDGVVGLDHLLPVPQLRPVRHADPEVLELHWEL